MKRLRVEHGIIKGYRLLGIACPIAKNHHVVFELHVLIRQIILLHQLANHRLEFARVAADTRFLMQQLQRNLPFILLAAMPAGKLVVAPVGRLFQPKIIALNVSTSEPWMIRYTQSESFTCSSLNRPERVSRTIRKLSMRPNPGSSSSPFVRIFVVMLVPRRRSNASFKRRYPSPLVSRFVHTSKSCALKCKVLA